MWSIHKSEDGSHVIPIEDLKPHTLTRACWCRPRDDENVIVHNSLDQREAIERGELQSN